VPEGEQREAAEGLGLSHYLPEPQASLPLMHQELLMEGQRKVKDAGDR
jgi:hypothetical protein